MDFPYQTALFAVGTGKQTRKLPIIHIENRVSKNIFITWLTSKLI